MGYLMLKLEMFDCNQDYIFKVALNFLNSSFPFVYIYLFALSYIISNILVL